MTITALARADHAAKDRLASCGIARTGVEVRVADPEDHDLPIGDVGEIVTRSDCVMAGYWGDPAAQAATLHGGWPHPVDVGAHDEHAFLTLKDLSHDPILSGGTKTYPPAIRDDPLLPAPGHPPPPSQGGA